MHRGATEQGSINYDFAHTHNRFEINVNEGRALPLLVLSRPVYAEDGHTVLQKGVLYMGDYIVDDFMKVHPNIKKDWFLVSTTQSHVIPTSVHHDLHLYTTQDGLPAPEYQAAATGSIPDLILGCGQFVDTDTFHPEPETPKTFDLIYVAKWAPTKRIELILDAAKADPSLAIAILGFPVVSERKRAASDAYRQLIIEKVTAEEISNVTIIEHEQEKHTNDDGTEVVGGFTKEEIRHFFNQAHCTILAADAKEGMNRSIPEALSCDVPFLLTRDTLGGVHTLMHAETGIFIEPSGEAIAQGISHLKEKREQLSPRAWFTDNFGQEKSNAKLRARVAEVAANFGQMVNVAEMRPYLGDIWSHEYYQHAVGAQKASE